MNCANHPDRERSAFCQNCGKPLCTECIRQSGSSIFCEQCLAARLNAAAAPPPGYGYPGYPPPAAGYPAPGQPVGSGEPNPGLAALLGFIPGVGAMYNEQYGKGIVHLIVFAILVTLASDVNGIFGLFIAGWIFYMVIEAHHTARARRDGTPLPNPFGLNDVSERLGFGKAWPAAAPGPAHYAAPPTVDPTAPPAAGPTTPPASAYAPPYNYTYVPPVSNWGAAQDAYSYGVPPVPPVPPMPPVPNYADPNLPYYRRFPSGAIWLIALGLFFLFGNVGIFHIFPGRILGPIFLIGFGVFIFVRKMTSTGQGLENDGTPLYHWRLTRAMNGSIWIVFTGVIWLLDELRILRWSKSWPLFIIAAGIMAILKGTMNRHDYATGYTPYPGTPTTPPAPPVTSTGIVPSDTHLESSSHDQEGR
jgi:hypothetical protein